MTRLKAYIDEWLWPGKFSWRVTIFTAIGAVAFAVMMYFAILELRLEKAEIQQRYSDEIARCKGHGGEPIVEETHYGDKLQQCYFPK